MIGNRALMRPLQVLLVALACVAVLAPQPAMARFDPMNPLGTNARPGIEIEVGKGDWGTARTEDIQVVLDAVAGEFLSHVGASGEALKIRVIPRSGSPRVRYERGANGEYVVQLTARDDRWFQYVFQFSHELCHVLSNFDHKEMRGGKVAEGNQWFEESLCEAASIFGLKRLAEVWESNPPKRDWMGYGAILRAYADHLEGEPHRRLSASMSFQRWFEKNQAKLDENPYLREKNEVVATNLLPLFERRPELWRAVTYLNSDERSAAKPFGAYLGDWYAACPDKALPSAIFALFGLDPQRPGSIQGAVVARGTTSSNGGTTTINGPNGRD